MTSKNVIISMSDCLKALTEFINSDQIRPKNQKLCSVENIFEVLQKFGVTVSKEPTNKVSRVKFIKNTVVAR